MKMTLEFTSVIRQFHYWYSDIYDHLQQILKTQTFLRTPEENFSDISSKIKKGSDSQSTLRLYLFKSSIYTSEQIHAIFKTFSTKNCQLVKYYYVIFIVMEEYTGSLTNLISVINRPCSRAEN